ncbi:ArsR family transcriptional regulator [Haloferax mediterranei ATCC 33500]|uniref:ArsR family transcriptional regulator n=2 Tax=Haloferacaceae TaxID=1644056 RepID=I3R479_HALMT|nr:winged helix-turn-helix domain-containing protein [Haloferax mediterranei]AFK19039.1 phage PhiH1 repressor protein-like protein [Haloferax mediterranei ATCC 33500]AHZ21602.1 phage PhiH1 repressor-like protein [Haloferax mediterranei ATCC 33500]EMA03697.1 phage PhiH1 repressor protein-like protein [Haloferax mediterranei ATCC 33500]QCQ75513.1 ArsR family transcriptional regulator [Haloferax mediterranei ATCC 33500]
MTGNDDKILELLAQGRLALNKKAIMVNFELRDIDISYSTVKRRLPMLEEAGLVKMVREQGGYYQITDDGLAYLNEEFEPPEL